MAPEAPGGRSSCLTDEQSSSAVAEILAAAAVVVAAAVSVVADAVAVVDLLVKNG